MRLTEEERKICEETVSKLKGSSQKARRARILPKVDADGPSWTDRLVADSFSCRTKTLENVRRRCVLEGYSNWSLRLLARPVVELEIVPSISHATINRTLEETAFPGARSNIG